MTFKKKILWVHLFRGPVGGVKNKNSIKFLFQHLLNLVLGKVKKFEGPSYHGSWAIAKMLRGGGPLRPPPMGDRVNDMFLVLQGFGFEPHTRLGYLLSNSTHNLRWCKFCSYWICLLLKNVKPLPFNTMKVGLILNMIVTPPTPTITTHFWANFIQQKKLKFGNKVFFSAQLV